MCAPFTIERFECLSHNEQLQRSSTPVVISIRNDKPCNSIPKAIYHHMKGKRI